MPKRREMGSLESDVLMCLWTSDTPLSPGEVQSMLGSELAYTTVMTILTRLWSKKLVERQRRGRAFTYRPLMSEGELVAARMFTNLRRSRDREITLARFVEGLSEAEATTLRRLIEFDGEPGR